MLKSAPLHSLAVKSRSDRYPRLPVVPVALFDRRAFRPGLADASGQSIGWVEDGGRRMVRIGVVIGLVAGALAGCAAQPPHWQERPNWARLGNTSTTKEDGPAFHRDPHHQYYDKGRKRYYYYDPAQKRFFWENGEPKA
jgi:hypothetical protein